MSTPETIPLQYVVLCVDSDADRLEVLIDEVKRICHPIFEVEGCEDAGHALKRVRDLVDDHVRVPLVICDQELSSMSGMEMLMALHETRHGRSSMKMLLVDSNAAGELGCGIAAGAISRTLEKPWTPDSLRGCVQDALTEHFLHGAPEEIELIAPMLNVADLSHALAETARERLALGTQLRTLQRSILAGIEKTDTEIEEAMIDGINLSLDHPEIESLPAGTVLIHQGEIMEGICILISGEVTLIHHSDAGEVEMPGQSVGRILGLLSLAQRTQAFYTCRALTDIVIVRLSFQQLDMALEKSPSLAGCFVATLIRSLANRNRRLTALHVEVHDLNQSLQSERDQLASALKQLELTQMQLIEAEKMASLGQLSAGVAHELNNPIGAIKRSADHLLEDMQTLIQALPERDRLQAVIDSAMNRKPLSTREMRERRRHLTKALGDADLADRVVRVGVTSPEDYSAVFGGLSGDVRERRISEIEPLHRLGTSLRNIHRCADRVTALVKSLRSYSRSDQAEIDEVDVHECLEDTLLLFGHRIRNIEVERQYGDLPTIACRVGEINQVWTNIISNALQAMGDDGRLRIETDAAIPGQIRVAITDSGPGIASENLPRVFDLHFTTKEGRVEFGLGMGLAICHQIVHRHGGAISIESEPGRTCVTVVLPVDGSGHSNTEDRT